MKKLFITLSIFLLAGCSVGNIELVKKAAFCEINGESFQSGESIPLADGCNFCACSTNGEIENCTENKCEELGLANPAAVKCSEDGFDYEIREDDEGGQFGVCIDDTESECDAWEYFRDECALGEEEEEVAEEEEIVEEELVAIEEEEIIEEEIAEEEVVEEEVEVSEEEVTEETTTEI